jgi:hypothetical protein
MWTNDTDLADLIGENVPGRIFLSKQKWKAGDFRVMLLPCDPESLAALELKIGLTIFSYRAGVRLSKEQTDNLRLLGRLALSALGLPSSKDSAWRGWKTSK